MILFEENMKSWLDKALSFHPDESEHPVDFSERFIMAYDTTDTVKLQIVTLRALRELYASRSAVSCVSTQNFLFFS